MELGRNDNSVIDEYGNGENDNNPGRVQQVSSGDDENGVPDTVGGTLLEESKFNHMFQGDCFEETLGE